MIDFSKVKDAIDNIEGQLENGYIDLDFHDELELNIIREAIQLYKIETRIRR